MLKLKLKDEEFYWLNATAIDPQDPLMIGQYFYNGTTAKWYIGGQFYRAGSGIDVVKHIPKPRNI